MSLSRQASIRRYKKSATKLFTQTGTELGSGAYGLIFEVYYQGSLCAAKKVHPTLLQNVSQDEIRKIKENFITLRMPNLEVIPSPQHCSTSEGV